MAGACACSPHSLRVNDANAAAGRGLPALRGAVSLRTGSPLYRTATQLRAHQSAKM
jgi:hypothetical protein